MPTDTYLHLPAEKRARIETVALEEFSQNGLAGASINTIVARAGIAKGSFYQYFADKTDLHRHLLTLAPQAKALLAAGLEQPISTRDTFGYLRWLLQVEVLFELRHPLLAKLEKQAFADDPLRTFRDEATLEGDAYTNRFHALLTQGILRDDVATWVDAEMAAFMLAGLSHLLGAYLIQRMGPHAVSLKDGSVDIAFDPYTQDLFDNVMDLLEAGLARDPQIRKDYFSK